MNPITEGEDSGEMVRSVRLPEINAPHGGGTTLIAHIRGNESPMGIKGTPLSPPQPPLPGFSALVRFNTRAMLKPWSLILLAVSAMSSYFAAYMAPSFRYVQDYNPGSWAGHVASQFGGAVLHPLIFIPYAFVGIYGGFYMLYAFTGLVAFVYVVACSLVAEDSGCLPSSLLHSRPVSRTSFLLTSFFMRFVVFAALGYTIPFLVGYAQNVADIGAAIQPVITQYMTMEEWYAMAWNGLLWEYVTIFVAYIFTLAALGLLVAVVSRRGLVSIPVTVLLVWFLGAIALEHIGNYIFAGHPFPTPAVALPSFYLIAAIDSTIYSMLQSGGVKPIFGILTGTALLALYGATLLAFSVIAYKRRGGAE